MICNVSEKEQKKRKMILLNENRWGGVVRYSVCFLLVSVLVFIGLWISKRTFIYKTDGWTQHYKALVYWGRYLRTLIKNLFLNHSFSIAEWDPAIGEGSDILTTLHYYVIGDPLCLMAAFVPTKYMWILYNMLSLIRLYLSGLVFTLFCYSTGQKNKYGVLAGSMTYTFCGWALRNSTVQVTFINPMIYLPLILMGVEKVIRKKRKGLLTGSVFLAACSNFYFFYMLVCITVVYTVVRLLILFRNKFRKGLQILFRIAIASLTGVLLSAFIILPVMYTFVNNGRMSVHFGKWLLYPLSYYVGLPGAFISNIRSYSMTMIYSVTVIPALFLLFKEKKQYRILKIFFVICMIIVMIPSLGQALNGFSYIVNRWCFALAMLVSYILVVMWDRLMLLSGRDADYVLLCCIGYSVVCMLLYDFNQKETMLSLVLLFILLCVLIGTNVCGANEQKNGMGKRMRNLQWRQIVMVWITIASICVYSFNRYYFGNSDETPDSWISINETEYLLQTEAKLVKMLRENEKTDEAYRYSGRNITSNANMLAGISSTDYYWSIANPYAAEFRSIMGVEENCSYHYSNYSDSATLTMLSGTDYYVVRTDDRQPVPYGFSYVNAFDIHEQSTTAAMEKLQKELKTTELSERNKQRVSELTAEYYSIYKNNNPLPIAYSYDKAVSEEAWRCLNSVEMQEVLEQAVVLEQADGSLKEQVSLNSQVLDETLICNGSEVTKDGNSFIVTEPGASITLSFAGVPDSETYVLVDGLHYNSSTAYELYFGDQKKDPLNLYNKTRWDLLSYGDRRGIVREHLFEPPMTTMRIKLKSSAGVVKFLDYLTPYWLKYCEREDFAINFGYAQEPITEITITFPCIGTYSYDSIKVACKPMGNFSERMYALKSCTLEHMKMDNDTISGTIRANQDRWLCMAIPYSSGWHAYLDGRETALHRANIQYMAVQIPTGEHEIRLVYETPLLRVGVCISAVTALLCIAGMICIKMRRRESYKSFRNQKSSDL